MLLIAASIWLVGRLPPQEGTAHVIDGDTLILRGKRIRLAGIDAPELHQSCRRFNGSNWACGRRAKEALHALVRGKRISCRAIDKDVYGRIIAFCRIVFDREHEGKDVGLALVEEGLAIARADAPLSYHRAQRQARNARTGLWQGLFEDPAEWRRKCRAAPSCSGG